MLERRLAIGVAGLALLGMAFVASSFWVEGAMPVECQWVCMGWGTVPLGLGIVALAAAGVVAVFHWGGWLASSDVVTHRLRS